MTLIAHTTVTDTEDDDAYEHGYVLVVIEWLKRRVFVSGPYKTRDAASAYAESERARGIINPDDDVKVVPLLPA